MACFTVLDTTNKFLFASVPLLMVLWFRYVFQAVVTTALMWPKHGMRLFRAHNYKLQIARGMLLLLCSALAFFSLLRMPVAEFTAIYCLVPLAVTFVARFVMKEHVSTVGWLCVAGGLCGALLVVRPGGHVDPTGAALALMGVVCYTGFQTLTGYLARQDSPLTIQLCTSAFGFLCLSMVLPFFWPNELPWPDLALLLFVALAGSYGQYFTVLAFSKAPASALSPYLYTAIGFSALGGWLMFDHLPDAFAVGGMAMIAGFGLLAGYLGQRKTAT